MKLKPPNKTKEKIQFDKTAPSTATIKRYPENSVGNQVMEGGLFLLPGLLGSS